MRGTIKSWNYPEGTDKPFKCTYIIDAKKTMAIKVKFLSVKIHSNIRQCLLFLRGVETSEDYMEVSAHL